MIYLEFSTISSPGGTRDCFVDFTGALETIEVIATADVVSSDATTLEISKVAVNNTPTEDGAEIGKGIHFSMETLQEANETITLEVSYVGDAGSAERYVVAVPVASVVAI